MGGTGTAYRVPPPLLLLLLLHLLAFQRSLSAMSSTIGIAEHEPDPNSVGYKFVKQYYEALSKEPAKLHRYVSHPLPSPPLPAHTPAFSPASVLSVAEIALCISPQEVLCVVLTSGLFAFYTPCRFYDIENSKFSYGDEGEYKKPVCTVGRHP